MKSTEVQNPPPACIHSIQAGGGFCTCVDTNAHVWTLGTPHAIAVQVVPSVFASTQARCISRHCSGQGWMSLTIAE